MTILGYHLYLVYAIGVYFQQKLNIFSNRLEWYLRDRFSDLWYLGCSYNEIRFFFSQKLMIVRNAFTNKMNNLRYNANIVFSMVSDLCRCFWIYYEYTKNSNISICFQCYETVPKHIFALCVFLKHHLIHKVLNYDNIVVLLCLFIHLIYIYIYIKTWCILHKY